MRTLPAGLTRYHRTPDFTEETVPAGLLRDHKTKPGVWGVIHVLSGRLLYVIPSMDEEVVIDGGGTGVVIPEVPHHVTPQGPVRFHVEFWR